LPLVYLSQASDKGGMLTAETDATFRAEAPAASEA